MDFDIENPADKRCEFVSRSVLFAAANLQTDF